MKISANLSAIKVPFELPLPNGSMLERFVWSYVYGGSVVIDAGVRGFSKLLERELEEVFPGSQGPETLLFTHAHPDHIGGARCVLHSWPLCRTAAHEDAVSWIEDINLQFEQRPVPGFFDIVGGRVEVNRTLTDGDIIETQHGRIRVIDSHGHCAGHCSFLIESERALICGDVVPAPGVMPIYEDVEQLRESLNKLLVLVPEADVLLSSWDIHPSRGENEMRQRIDAGLRWIDTVYEAVLNEGPSAGDDIMATAARVAAQLHLPAFAANNPLFARTIAAHLRDIDAEREGEV